MADLSAITRNPDRVFFAHKASDLPAANFVQRITGDTCKKADSKLPRVSLFIYDNFQNLVLIYINLLDF